MASHSPIPPADDGFFKWARTSAFDDAIVTLNKLCALEVISAGNRFPVRFAGENAVIEINPILGSTGGGLTPSAAFTVIGNPTAITATPVATSDPILSSITFGGIGGGSVSGTSGAIAFVATGSNNNITFTPGGIGAAVFSSVNTTNGPTATFHNSSSVSSCNLRIFNDQNSTARTLNLIYTGSSFSGAPFVSGGIAGESASILTAGAYALQFGTANIYRGAISAVGNWLLGTSTDDGSNLLQVSGTIALSTTLNFAAGGTIATPGAGLLFTNGSNSNLLLTVAAGSSAQGLLNFQAAGTPKWYVGKQSDETFLINDAVTANNAIKITTGGPMQIMPSAGRVLIGTTSDDGSTLLQVNGAIKTAAPSGGTAAAWKFGSIVTAAVTPDLTRYVELDIGGTLVKVALVT